MWVVTKMELIDNKSKLLGDDLKREIKKMQRLEWLHLIFPYMLLKH